MAAEGFRRTSGGLRPSRTGRRNSDIRFVLAAVPARHHHHRQTLVGLARAAAGRRDWQLLHHPELVDDPRLLHRSWRPDAMVCAGAVLAQRARRAGIPVVALSADGAIPDVPTVALDEASVGRVAVAHLVECGYRRLAMVAPRPDEQPDRQAAVVAAAAAAGVPLTIVRSPWPGQRRSLLEDLDRLGRALAALAAPAGVFCLNDALAWMAAAACRRVGLAVPGEIGLLGADDDPLAVLAGPVPLSSVAVPHAEVGRRAAALLADVLAGRTPPARTRVPATEVVARASTRLERLPDPAVAAAVAWITRHAHEPIGVDAVAAAARLPRRTLERRFREQLGSTVLDELQRQRMAVAKRLLREGRPVAEVAAAVGMSASAFAEAFVRRTGATPGAWRDGAR